MTAPPFPPSSSIAAYLRDSGGDAQDLSVAQQESEIRAWCKENQITLSKIFTDEAAPGSSTVGRTGFLEMISYFTANKKIPETGIVVWKFSRFAREIDDAQYYKADLRRRGYTIHSLNESIPQGLDGRLFEAAIDWMNARFLEDLSADVKRGLQHNMTTYGAIGGTPPRGFRRSQPIIVGARRDGKPHTVHRWEPDPELVPIVRQAYEMRASGASYQDITSATNLYKSKQGWLHFFSNKIYIGTMEFGGKTIENYCDPIIEKNLWDRVQEINNAKTIRTELEKLRDHPRVKSSDYILTGLLRCGHCQSPLTGDRILSKKGKTSYAYYKCARRKSSYGQDCQALGLPKDLLEKTIITEMTNHILTFDNLVFLRDLITSQREDNIAQTNKILNDLQKRLTTIRNQIDRLTDAIAESGTSPSILKKLKQREDEERFISSQISQVKYNLDKLSTTISDEKLLQISKKTTAVIQNADRQTVRLWLYEIIHHIEVKREKIGKKHKISGVIYYYQPQDLCLQGSAPKGTRTPV
jgi:site-specific DNA recombinase